ncbi:phage tail tape measure protein [Hymenobacter baengnokdamensis]|uniref:phage tail tape measure protein n=1 Tax=Hymenobacter baengnokdamensis TaxID=2615203 RepID=UPI0012443689|nr:phage tail tape measure protein [Hymenobacter baengnokdamensis]
MAGPIKYEDLFSSLGAGSEEVKLFTDSVTGLSKSYKAFAKNLDSDGQKVTSALAAVATQTAGLRQQLTTTALLTDQERAGYAALSAQLGQLFQEQQRLQAAEAGIATTRKATTEATRVLTSELRQQQTALKEAYAAGNTEGIRKAATEILNLKASSEDLNRALRGANSTYTAAAGSYRAMENEARALSTQLKALEGGMGSNADEVRDLQKRLGDVNEALISFGRGVNDGHANVGRYAESIIEAVGSLEKQRSTLLTNTEALRTQSQATNLSREQQQQLQNELEQTEAELQKVNGELRNYGVGVKQSGGATAALSDNATSLAQSFAGAYYGIQGVATALQQVFEENIKYSDSIADVAKTTGLTIEQTNTLADSLKKLNTRTSLQGLLDIAGVGGQLGVAATDIESFTKAIDISVQALGNDFTGGAEEIATALGKINTVFGKGLGTDLSQNLLHIGSALNQLGAVGAATAPQLADVALRTGAIAANAGLGLDKVLGYATVLQEVGFSAETSGTALNKLFSTLSTRTQASFDIAKLGDANLTLKEFKRLVNTDFEGAIQAFLKGLNAGGDTTTRMNALLKTLKLQSSEAKSAIISLAGNLDTYTQRQAVANQELASGNSVAAEAAIKNDTLGGSYEKLKNSISNLFTNSGLGDFLKEQIDETRERLQWVADGLHKIGDAVSYIGEKVGLVDKPLVDFTANIVTHTQALTKQATSQQGLLDSYTKLAGATTRSGEQELQLAQARAKLVEQFGTSEAAAIQTRIDGLRQEADANKDELRTKLKNYTDYVEQTAQETAKLQEIANKSAEAFSHFGLSAEGVQNLQDAAASSGLANQVMGRSFPAEQVASAKELNKAQDALAVSTDKLTKGKQELARIAAALQQLDSSGATKAQTRATDDDVEADKKKKQSVADVAKEEFELQKQRLQARITDLDRQADNPANSEAIRTASAAKAVQARIQLAALERDELIREADKTNKDKLNGDAATAVARVRLTEAFQEQLLKATRDGDNKQLALRNALLNQLAELDKLGLESEITAAEKVRDNVNKTYDERQKAARDTAHAQIELAALVRDTEIRNAQGALDKIELANQKYDQARANASASVKVYDSQKDIDEQDARYARLLLGTEDLHAKQFTSEKTYLHEVRDLENQREAEAIAALEAEYGETADVLRRKAALRKKMSGEELADEKEKEQQRAHIIETGLQTVQGLVSGFFDFQTAQLAAQEQNEQDSYDSSIKAAGDNVALKAKIEADHAKASAKIKHDQAVVERNQALFSIAINTAMAVGKSLGEFGLPVAIPFIAADIILGGIQAAAVLSKPIPQYFKGRTGGPAEFAQLAEKGPELVGKPGAFRLVTLPTVGYLQAGEQVLTADKTQQLLQQADLVQGRLTYRHEQADMEQQTARLRGGDAHRQQVTTQRAFELANHPVVSELQQVRKAIHEMEYERINNAGEIERWMKREQSKTRFINKYYRSKPTN